MDISPSYYCYATTPSRTAVLSPKPSAGSVAPETSGQRVVYRA